MSVCNIKQDLEDMIIDGKFSSFATILTDTVLWKKSDMKDVFPNSIAIEYPTGGYSGGNCWGGKAEHYTEDTSSFADVNDELILPIITICDKYYKYSFSYGLEIMKKLKNLVKTTSYEHREYYGNSIEYAVHYIVISDIIKLLENE